MSPWGGLVLLNDTLYGTTTWGGTANNTGTVFAINTNGSPFTVLHVFTGGNDEGRPECPLLLSGNHLYGTASGAGEGTSQDGTIFSITLPVPSLSILSSGPDVVLTWPASSSEFNFSDYVLQSITDLSQGAWATVSPAPVVVNGQNTVTNSAAAEAMFYRLSQQ